MNPEQRIAELERIVEDMRQGRDIVFLEQTKRLALFAAIQAGVKSDGTDLNQSVGAAQAFTAPLEFDKKVRVEIDGAFYYLGLYDA